MQTVISKDGTKIAYDKLGKGPAIILVVGALASRSDHAKLAELLSLTLPYTIMIDGAAAIAATLNRTAVKREVEDIEALINKAGGSAYVYGISSGACLALEAAPRLATRSKS